MSGRIIVMDVSGRVLTQAVVRIPYRDHTISVSNVFYPYEIAVYAGLLQDGRAPLFATQSFDGEGVREAMRAVDLLVDPAGTPANHAGEVER